MDSSLLLVFCVALSALSSTRGAPARSAGEVNFSECKALSIKLNEMARDLYNTVRTSRMIYSFDHLSSFLLRFFFFRHLLEFLIIIIIIITHFMLSVG